MTILHVKERQPHTGRCVPKSALLRVPASGGLGISVIVSSSRRNSSNAFVHATCKEVLTANDIKNRLMFVVS